MMALSRSYRWLNLNPMRAGPPATMTAAQLTDFGTDQSPMMMVHSSKIRAKWNSATTAKIIPATKEDVFWSMVILPLPTASPVDFSRRRDQNNSCAVSFCSARLSALEQTFINPNKRSSR